MLLLVGLGNPGSNYTNTRHNIGFKIIDAINAHFKLSKQKPKFKGLLTTGNIDEKKIYAIKPLTFMNNSGTAIKELIDYFKIDAKDVFVFHDDMDIDFGKIKAKFGGSSAGHNGIESIDKFIGKDYSRVRIGIGHPKQKKKVNNHVLEDFKEDEEDKINEITENIVKQFNIDLFYTIGWGAKTDAFNCVPCPVLTHAIFSNSPFTREGWETKDRYAVISKYLTTKHSCSKNYIPHMINMPNANDNKSAHREKYNIPGDAFVLGRYGGTDSFDIGYVHEAIKQILSEENNIYFLFANTDKFYEHERIIYTPQLIDMDEKASFIQCCDAMIHGRTVGETFGISIGEFSFYNKPIITNCYGREIKLCN